MSSKHRKNNKHSSVVTEAVDAAAEAVDAVGSPKRKSAEKKIKVYSCYAIPDCQTALANPDCAALVSAIRSGSESVQWMGACRGSGPILAAHKKVKPVLAINSNLFVLREHGQHTRFRVYVGSRERKPIEYELNEAGQRVSARNTVTGETVKPVIKNRGAGTPSQFWIEHEIVVRPAGVFECDEKPRLPTRRAGASPTSDDAADNDGEEEGEAAAE
jgi:hypothetical protein